MLRPSDFAVVYFLRAVGTDHIKIGWAVDIERRLKTLRRDFPLHAFGHPWEVLATIRHDSLIARRAEANLHRRFKHLRFGREREIFKQDPEILDYISGLQAVEHTVEVWHDRKARQYVISCCPWCGLEHRHGDAGLGGRVPHCPPACNVIGRHYILVKETRRPKKKPVRDSQFLP